MARCSRCSAGFSKRSTIRPADQRAGGRHRAWSARAGNRSRTHNLVLEVDKLFALGDAARDDTLLRAAYSYTVGTDLRVIDPSWPTWYVYAEVDRFLEKSQLVGITEGRFGRSFRLDPISSKLVFFPHAVLAASYDNSFANLQAYSAGVGGSLRYWFGETKYLAPPSYWELTLQYRLRLAGDQRAEGIFAQTSINY